MKLFRSLSIICIAVILISCGEGDDKGGKAIEKEAKESADKAAEKSFQKLNSGSDTAKSDSTTE